MIVDTTTTRGTTLSMLWVRVRISSFSVIISRASRREEAQLKAFARLSTKSHQPDAQVSAIVAVGEALGAGAGKWGVTSNRRESNSRARLRTWIETRFFKRTSRSSSGQSRSKMSNSCDRKLKPRKEKKYAEQLQLPVRGHRMQRIARTIWITSSVTTCSTI